jgi:hypothetical protein
MDLQGVEIGAHCTIASRGLRERGERGGDGSSRAPELTDAKVRPSQGLNIPSKKKGSEEMKMREELPGWRVRGKVIGP